MWEALWPDDVGGYLAIRPPAGTGVVCVGFIGHCSTFGSPTRADATEVILQGIYCSADSAGGMGRGGKGLGIQQAKRGLAKGWVGSIVLHV